VVNWEKVSKDEKKKLEGGGFTDVPRPIAGIWKPDDRFTIVSLLTAILLRNMEIDTQGVKI
jgi:hypothetical protein